MDGPIHHLYLVPGFFGFAQLGDVKYFSHVRDLIEPAFEARGLRVAVHYVPTLPTASLQRRAKVLYDMLAETAGDAGPIHLIGHSSGGLDARLLTSPNFELGNGHDPEVLLGRVASVVGIAVPHRGTPLASFFDTLSGRRVLRVLSLASLVMLRRGRLPMGVAKNMLGLLRRVDNPSGLDRTVLDQFFEQLLADFSPERQEQVRNFFVEAYRDQSLLAQLTPQGMATLNARLDPRPGVRYGDVVLRARPPKAMDVVEVGFDTYAQVLHRIYKWLHRLSGGGKSAAEMPLGARAASTLAREFGDAPSSLSSDGIVPTRSQVMGEVVHAAWADHLDAIGHFDDAHHHPPHFDWLPSASRFRRRHFERLWNDVLEFILADAAVQQTPGVPATPA